MKNYFHIFFASCLLGSLISWYFFTTKPYPTFAVPIIIVWLIYTIYKELSR